MKLMKDIDTIKKLSRQKDEENWGFRSFLKSSGLPGKKIDIIVQRINKKISERIDCTACANCCREVKPGLKAEDIANMAAGLQISPASFKKKYLEKSENEGEYLFNKLPCPFLKNNLCTAYNFRPNACRSYPHLHLQGFVSRTISVVNNCAICPIVFNVYEELKREVWEMADFDDYFE